MILMWIFFTLFFAVYMFKMFPLWLVLSVWSLGLAVFLLIKNKLPSLKYIIISVIYYWFSVVVSSTYASSSGGGHSWSISSRMSSFMA